MKHLKVLEEANPRGDEATAPSTRQGGGGHPWILSDLKSLLETGKGLAG